MGRDAAMVEFGCVGVVKTSRCERVVISDGNAVNVNMFSR